MTGIEYIFKYMPKMVEKAFLPDRKGWTALDENGTGKVSGINLEEMGKRFKKAADAADAIGEVNKIIKSDKIIF